jgi:hypothetical protein
MKRLIKLSLIFSAIVLLSYINPPKYIYGIQFTDIDGKETSLLPYRGMKVMVIIISGQEKDSIGIVAIPSIEDGYTEADKAIVKRLFAERDIRALITGGFYTRKSAGSNQAELMQWFTNKAHNMREDRDISGPGHRFFLDEMGGLQFSVFPPISYSVPFIQNYMHWPVRPYPVIPGKEQKKKQN